MNLTEKQLRARRRAGKLTKTRPEPGDAGMHFLTRRWLHGVDYRAFLDLTQDKLERGWSEFGRAKVRLLSTEPVTRAFGVALDRRNRITLKWGARTVGRWGRTGTMGMLLRGVPSRGVPPYDAAPEVLWALGWQLSCADANNCARAIGEPVPWSDPLAASLAMPALEDAEVLSATDRLFDPEAVRYPRVIVDCISGGRSWRPPSSDE